MNISEAESLYVIVAKTCGSADMKKKVTYSLIESYHSLCHDKKDLTLGQIEACERLKMNTAQYGRNDTDKQAIQNEINELKMVLDLMQ